MYAFNEIYFFTEAQINITITKPIFLASYEIYKIRSAVAWEPSKKRKRGFCDATFMTQRIELKIITNQQFLCLRGCCGLLWNVWCRSGEYENVPGV